MDSTDQCSSADKKVEVEKKVNVSNEEPPPYHQIPMMQNATWVSQKVTIYIKDQYLNRMLLNSLIKTLIEDSNSDEELKNQHRLVRKQPGGGSSLKAAERDSNFFWPSPK
ncbi:hypothetical protein TOT_010000946 [Theileria orientalis strain Shintoku]|uniref:Uncharacterized protein n=1 Tax=Theileria orientalis strain Shintoku TaxID=869250 RepID=J4C2Y3_THEOR|nr:hypothetical protein TOT_010000946 [Theileria orientalis strain Shintoku]BAM39491.1 hypothetical protein TOT_010000946 [Theileria orientalis strain Shintoku]|eukprot:XP_009689792.1 hypothetical protein TOT_010000946 [Theileria orientalis strain Shintoku]